MVVWAAHDQQRAGFSYKQGLQRGWWEKGNWGFQGWHMLSPCLRIPPRCPTGHERLDSQESVLSREWLDCKCALVSKMKTWTEKAGSAYLLQALQAAVYCEPLQWPVPIPGLPQPLKATYCLGWRCLALYLPWKGRCYVSDLVKKFLMLAIPFGLINIEKPFLWETETGMKTIRNASLRSEPA